MFAVACARPPPCRLLSGGRSAGLTHRAQLPFPRLLLLSEACAHCDGAAASNGGFLAEIFECNPKLRQQASAIASADFQEKLHWAEVAATHPTGAGDIDRAPGTQLFRDTLRDTAISMSSAHGDKHIVFVRWRSDATAPDGVSKLTIYNVGFNLPELRDEFVSRAELANRSSPGGLRILGSAVAVSAAAAAKGFRFYVPMPAGWTDEQLLHAMVMQGGLNPDHVLSFGADLARGLDVIAPSGDLYFNFAPAGCIEHGFKGGAPILQPPERMFVSHPDTGVESHLKIRKAGACKWCWLPGRHDTVGNKECPLLGLCKMCLEPFEEMPQGGKRHACSQGHVYKEPVSRPVDPGTVPDRAPPLSPLAAKLKQQQEHGLRIAKEKRKRLEADSDQGLTPSQAAAQVTPPAKSAKATGNSSPAGTAEANTATKPPAPAPAEDSRKAGQHGGRGKRNQ
jgi:hypothetical protein